MNPHMKVNCTEEIQSFMDRCMFHIQSDWKSEFVGMHITKAQEKQIQREMHEAGFHEFAGSEDTWPSLFLSSSEWAESPYHSSISLDLIKDENFSFETVRTAGRELFNADAIVKDPDRELNDSMVLRAMDRNFDAIYLYQDDDEWMVDAPSEAATNDAPAARAHGKVVTFGLGIGYFIFMAMRNPLVKEITVVESSAEVIAMFERFLYPQFPHDIPLHFIHGDAFDYFNESFLSGFDYIYTDIWKSAQDGLEIMEKLLHQYVPPFEKADFWIEDSCEEIMWTLIFLYFEAIAHDRIPEVNPIYESQMQKIRAWFDPIEHTITDPKEIQFYMYDTDTIRNILSL